MWMGKDEKVPLLIFLKLFKQQTDRNKEHTKKKTSEKGFFLNSFCMPSHSTLTSWMIDLGACYFGE